ncbi:MAG: HAMP domain-containing sensor histidine kinase [Kofleriaceae bacterium]
MEAVAVDRRPVMVISRRRLISAAVISMSVGITGLMSFIFYREVRVEMLATGFICAVIIDRVIRGITKNFRIKVARLQDELEQRVIERTAELSAMRTELHVRDRLATAGTLAAGVCHEIRSPLAVMVMGLEELGEAPLDDNWKMLLTDLVDATERINVIVKDLSSLAKPGSEELAPVELAPVIEGAARLASYKFDARVKVDLQLAAIPPVTGNAGRLGQVVLNLLTNAARASKPDVDNRITVRVTHVADRVVLAISDTGTGMSKETQKRLFEPFFTTGADRGGTGLGLAICRSIVQRMGGEIAIRSELDAGTTVEVSLRKA